MSNKLALSVRLPEMGGIDLNFEELKSQISNTMTIYKNKEYTEETRQLAKNDRADLNKFRTALENKRKEVKKAWNAPYIVFEGKIKELVSLVSEPIELIDEQVSEFEQKIINEKLAEAVAYYTEKLEETKLEKILSWEKVEQKDFYNLTKTIKQIQKDIDEKIERTLTDWATIEGFKSEYEFEMKEAYKETLDLQQAIQKGQQLKAEAERKAAYEAERQAKEKAAAEEAAIKKEQAAKDMFIQPEITEKKVPVKEREKVYQVAFRVSGTAEELKALSDFLKKNSYTYEQIKGA